MKTKSAKSKGRKLQDFVRDLIHEYTGIRLKTRIIGECGDDVYPIDKDWPIYVECKNCEKLSIWSVLKSVRNKTKKVPVLIIKRNHEEPVAVIPLSGLTSLGFFDILKGSEVKHEETKKS